MIIEKIKLPSNGLLGYPADITIREMKGSELSAIYTSLSDASVEYVLGKCIVEPEGLDVSELSDQDKAFIMVKLRIISLGDTVKQFVRSPYSSKMQEVEVDLTALDVVYLSEEELGRELTIKDQNNKEYSFKRRIPNKKVMEEILIAKEKHNISSYDDALLRVVSLMDPKIKAPDGYKVRPVHEMVDFLSNLPGKVLLEVFKYIDLQFGIVPTFTAICEQTKQEFLGVLAFSADLFR